VGACRSGARGFFRDRHSIPGYPGEDDGTRLEAVFPETVCAVFDDGGLTWIVLGERDGSLEVRPFKGTWQDPARPAGARRPAACRQASVQYTIT
jgi:hypothetical protein